MRDNVTIYHYSKLVNIITITMIMILVTSYNYSFHGCEWAVYHHQTYLEGLENPHQTPDPSTQQPEPCLKVFTGHGGSPTTMPGRGNWHLRSQKGLPKDPLGPKPFLSRRSNPSAS